MRHLLIATIVAAATITLGQIASAADMPVKAPTPAPISLPGYNWTGFYVGGNVGGVTEHASGTSTFTDPAPTFGGTIPQSISNTRFLGGVQGGYNWQFAPSWVLGIEGDWDWTDTGYSFCGQDRGASAAFGCSTSTTTGVQTISSKTKWLATARGRLGFAWDRWMVYGTGGAAWGSVDTTITQDCRIGCGSSPTTVNATSATNATKSGWVAGLGVEAFVVGNWTARAEWLHIDLGTVSASLATPVGVGTQTTTWSRTERFDEFRVGINYVFR